MMRTTFRGHCLCGRVGFVVTAPVPALYRCHCSYCRRQSGASSNTATLVPSRRLSWTHGTSSIRQWRDDSGFRSDFCGECGSPVPNEISAGGYWWVPAGLFDDLPPVAVVADLFVGSRAHWSVPAAAMQFDAMPGHLDAFIALLNTQGQE